MANVRQNNFGSGEWDPRLWGRTDLEAYASGARKINNFFPTHYGSILSRPGTYWVNNTKNNAEARLIPFNYGDITGQNYILEFTEYCIRFHNSQGTIYESSPPYAAYEVVTPYTLEDIPRLKYIQVGDVLTIVHPNYPPKTLTRHSEEDWRLEDVVFGVNSIYYPAPVSAPLIDRSTEYYPAPDPTTHPRKAWKWVATAVYADGTESGPSPFEEANNTTDETSGLIACYSDAPVYLLMTYLPGFVSLRIYKGREGVYGYVGSVVEKTTLTYSTGATFKGHVFIDDGIEPDYSIVPPRIQRPFSIPLWTSGTKYYVGDKVYLNGNVYECIEGGLSQPGGSGPTGTAVSIYDGAPIWVANHAYTLGNYVTNRGRTFLCNQTGTSASGTATGPWGTRPLGDPFGFLDGTARWEWFADGDGVYWKYVGSLSSHPNRYPASVAIFEQRRVFGGTAEEPGTIFASRTNRWEDFSTTIFSNATDALKFELASRRRVQIRSLVPLRHLMTLTNSAEWVVGGAANGDPMSPNSIRARAHSERGSSWLDPVVIGDVLIHVQPKGTIVRDLYYDVNIDSYTGSELSLISKHFFRGHDIKSWAWAEDPYSVVWIARDDGKLLSMTYVKEQKLWAWAQHTTDGEVESIASIPEGFEDSVYMVVKRGNQRFVERMATREISAVADAHCLDAGVVALGAVSSVSGLDHLEGRTVSALIDGNVVEDLTVSGGSVTLPYTSVAQVHVGLPYVCEFESLDVAEAREKQKIVKEVLIEVEGSRGVWIGETLEDMDYWYEWAQRTPADLFGAIPLTTGVARVTVSGRWGLGGRVAVQQRAPLPLSIIAIQRELGVGGS